MREISQLTFPFVLVVPLRNCFDIPPELRDKFLLLNTLSPFVTVHPSGTWQSETGIEAWEIGQLLGGN